MSISFDDINNKSENIIKNITKDLKKDILKKSFFGNIISNIFNNIDEEKEDKEFLVKLYGTAYIVTSIILGIIFSSFPLFLVSLFGTPILFFSKIFYNHNKFKKIDKKYLITFSSLSPFNFNKNKLNTYLETLDNNNRYIAEQIIGELSNIDNITKIQEELFEHKLNNVCKEELIQESGAIFHFISKKYNKKKRMELLEKYEQLLDKEDTNDKIKEINMKINKIDLKSNNKKSVVVKI